MEACLWMHKKNSDSCGLLLSPRWAKTILNSTAIFCGLWAEKINSQNFVTTGKLNSHFSLVQNELATFGSRTPPGPVEITHSVAATLQYAWINGKLRSFCIKSLNTWKFLGRVPAKHTVLSATTMPLGSDAHVKPWKLKKFTSQSKIKKISCRRILNEVSEQNNNKLNADQIKKIKNHGSNLKRLVQLISFHNNNKYYKKS